MLGSCRRGCDCPPPVAQRPAEQLLVAPATLYVLEGTQFILRARHLDSDGGAQPITGSALTWTAITGGVSVVQPPSGDSAVLAAGSVATPTSNTVEVELNNRLSARANVIVVPNNPDSPTTDRIAAIAEKYPNYALIDGHANPGADDPASLTKGIAGPICRKNTWVAFVGMGLAGDLVGDCPTMHPRPDVKGEVTVFAPAYGAFRSDVTWSSGANTVTVSSTATDAFAPVDRPKPLTVSYTVFLAASGANQEKIQKEIESARETFRKEGTGLELNGTISAVAVPAVSVVVSGADAPLECARVREDLERAEVDVGTALDGARLTVWYVDDILGPPRGAGEISYPSGLAGYSCPHDPEDGSIILITSGLGSPTTLAHELGHTLGLRDDAGHTNELPGFSYTNIMWIGPDVNRPNARKHFTLGQTYRMNFDAQSWLHRTTNAAAPRPMPPQTCGQADEGLPCPTLAWDMFSPPAP
jgi:hypothetical protein